jgi:hypothetical protein
MRDPDPTRGSPQRTGIVAPFRNDYHKRYFGPVGFTSSFESSVK